MPIHCQPFPESVSKELEIYTDYDGYHRHHVKHYNYLSAYFSQQPFPMIAILRFFAFHLARFVSLFERIDSELVAQFKISAPFGVVGKSVVLGGSLPIFSRPLQRLAPFVLVGHCRRPTVSETGALLHTALRWRRGDRLRR